MLRPNNRPTALVAVIFILLILGLASLNGNFMALAIPAAVYLAIALLRKPSAVRVESSRSLSMLHVAPGQEVSVKLTVTVMAAAGSYVTLRDVVPAGLELVSGDISLLAPLPADGLLTLEYAVRGARGEFAFRDVFVSVAEATGVFQRNFTVHAPMVLLIRPHLRKLRPIALRPPRTRGFAGPIPARQSGSGVDFFGLRQYQQGDRLRWVNWRVSARHERSLFTNEYEQERVADIGIILDARAQNDVRTANGSLYDHSIQAAAALSDMFLDQGNRVGLLIYGRGREGVFPGYGNGQKERIFRALGRTASGHNYALESLNHLPARFFPAGSQIIFIGALTGADDVSVLTRIRAHGYGVIALSPNPIEFEAASLGDVQGVEMASRIAVVERRLAIAELRRVGVQLVDWRVDHPLDQTLHESLVRQPLQYR
ncbi:MAG TPA: DUF58 domain-containing protein, partial [Anaerolineae bacterium]